MTELERAIKELAEERVSLADVVELSNITEDLRDIPSGDRDLKTLEAAVRTIDGLVVESHVLRNDRDRWRHHCRNLLARIHRDGGHYLERHGLEKAAADADEIVAKMNSDIVDVTVHDNRHFDPE